ncbi:GNAT family N-acetyltransferase [Candidatus Protochlamydia sp. W-9]|uniref:GNAT family N-acetyltransferase n=1 Tax=Candidatus Protochlamydia sp. W-9 TaxID=1785087 RepID=UPI001178C93E|nr:GNAT family N-acetyltransferase [Candidatus Protochlamydia sp. W-9]
MMISTFFAWLVADLEVMQFSLIDPLAKEKTQVYLQKRILDHDTQYGYGLYAVEKRDCQFVGFVGLTNQSH